MRVNLIQVEEFISKKTGEITYLAVGLGTFNSFGKIKKATVDINLTKEQYEKYKKEEGKIVDLDVVMPLPNFPMILN